MRSDESQLQQLCDIEEIKQLKARYFRLMDTQRWEEWGLVFTTDALMEFPGTDMAYRGRDEIVRNVSAGLVGARTVHQGHMPEIELVAAGAARGTWAVFAYVEFAEQHGKRAGQQGYGYYIDEYAKEEAQWRINRIRLEMLRTDPLG